MNRTSIVPERIILEEFMRSWEGGTEAVEG